MVATGRGYTEATLLEEVGSLALIITLMVPGVNEKRRSHRKYGVSKKTVQTILEKINELGLYLWNWRLQGI